MKSYFSRRLPGTLDSRSEGEQPKLYKRLLYKTFLILQEMSIIKEVLIRRKGDTIEDKEALAQYK